MWHTGMFHGSLSFHLTLSHAAVAMNQLLSSSLPARVYESLSIGDGKQCWNVYADVVVLDYDGALLDCCSMGTYVSSQHAVCPCLAV